MSSVSKEGKRKFALSKLQNSLSNMIAYYLFLSSITLVITVHNRWPLGWVLGFPEGSLDSHPLGSPEGCAEGADVGMTNALLGITASISANSPAC